MKNDRCEDLDMGKALGMLAVFWGHLMLGGITNLSCYAVHIPFFFFLSGVVFRPERYGTFRNFLIRRGKGLLVPYLLFSAATWLWWVIRGALLGEMPARPLASLLETLVARGSAGYLRHNVALWFVTALFAAEMLYYFLERLPLAPRIPVLALCGLLGYALVQAGWPVDWLPWSLEAALTGVVFYGAGNIFAQTGGLDRMRRQVREHRAAAGLLSLGLLAVTVLGAGCNGHVSLAQGRLGRSLLLFYANASLGICGVLLLSILLTLIRLPEKLRSGLLWFGQHSFRAMAIHVPVMVDLVWIAGRFTDIHALRYQYAWTVPIFAGMLVITCLWMKLLEKCLRKQ